MMDAPIFIATAKLDDENARRLTQLRTRFFPPERNFLDAHVTLLHKISPAGLASLVEVSTELDPQPFEVKLASPVSIGRGMTIKIESDRLVWLRNQFASRLSGELSPQDRQKFAPHVTIQNKVTAEVARESLLEFRREWVPTMAWVEGIDLWEYLGGPWRHERRLLFRRDSSTSD